MRHIRNPDLKFCFAGKISALQMVLQRDGARERHPRRDGAELGATISPVLLANGGGGVCRLLLALCLTFLSSVSESGGRQAHLLHPPSSQRWNPESPRQNPELGAQRPRAHPEASVPVPERQSRLSRRLHAAGGRGRGRRRPLPAAPGAQVSDTQQRRVRPVLQPPQHHRVQRGRAGQRAARAADAQRGAAQHRAGVSEHHAGP